VAFGVSASSIDAMPLAAFTPVRLHTAIEFYHAGFDHYFVTQLAAEIDALDSGQTAGWTRTGRGFAIFTGSPPGTFSPVCRFYIPPEHGDSHFFSASIASPPSLEGHKLRDLLSAPLQHRGAEDSARDDNFGLIYALVLWRWSRIHWQYRCAAVFP
jgi:hypothetical protein